MILQREILEKAKEWKATAGAVDKDYALSHFLNCFFNFKDNRELFVFKGGTCLRKCYFPDYRFSEDLDFTLKDSKFLLNENFIKEIIQQCHKNSGVQFHLAKFENKQFLDEHKGYSCVISFWGANHNQNKPPAPKDRWMTKIELDFSIDEVILFPVKQLKINHPYSDSDKINLDPIPVYSLGEILAEKVRSFYQRSYKAPRDFYDVWYLLINHSFEDWNNLSQILKEKCQLKKVDINKSLFNDIEVKQTVSKAWRQSIEHHLPKDNLPDFEIVWRFLSLELFTNYFKF